MRLRDWVNKQFEKRDEVPQRRHDDPANLAAKARADMESKIDDAVDKTQADLLRTHQTPELTPDGTKQKTPPSNDQALTQAKKLVEAKFPREQKTGDKDQAPEAAKDEDYHSLADEQDLEDARKAEQAKPQATARDTTDIGTALRLPLQGEHITPPYIAEIRRLQAEEEVGLDGEAASWTLEERTARVNARIAEIEAEDLDHAKLNANTHETDSGKTI